MNIKKDSNRLMVIGLDGATFDIITPMVKAGRLPTLAKLMSEGAWGNLRSTILPVTPPAWSSFMTGKNPGKHGVFGFFTNKPDTYETELTTSLSIKAKKIWDYLDENEKVCLIDIPLTYPPQAINGHMISGLPVPSEESIFTYPPELHTELIREIGDYVIDKQLRMLAKGRNMDALKHLYAYTEMRFNAMKYLLKSKGPFDFFMLVLRGTDFIGHAAFKYFDKDYAKKHPGECDKFGDMIYQFYEKVDSYLAEILQLKGDDCNLLVMSDHGMGQLKKFFYINRWLRQETFLELKKYPKIRKIGYGLKKKKLRNILEKNGLSFFKVLTPGFLQKLNIYYVSLHEKHPSSVINWKKTRAYANLTWTDGILKINLKGREKEGGVEQKDYDNVCNELVLKLKNIVDPETGEKIMEAVHRRDEIYSGPYTKDSPDIIALTRDINYAYRVSIYGDELFETPQDPEPATHRMNGICIMNGPDIKNGIKLNGTSIMDLAPTILYLMGHKIPEDMDGKIITEAINEDFVKSTPVVFVKSTDDEKVMQDKHEFSDEDKKGIEDNLRALGYLT